jgi:hypothetical protein
MNKPIASHRTGMLFFKINAGKQEFFLKIFAVLLGISPIFAARFNRIGIE